MIGRGHENARMQSDFYRDCYHKILRFIIYEVIVMLLLIGAIIYIILFEATPPYYATTSSGQIIQLTDAG